jgi:hypothetical protein
LYFTSLERNEKFVFSGYASNNAGAGHGGEGGGISDSTSGGSAYDSYLKPSSPGSGGVTTYGGGVLHIQVKSLIHGGEIKAKYVNIVVSDKIVVFIQKPNLQV